MSESPPRRALLPWVLIPPVTMLVVVALASRLLDISADRFTRDPTAILNGHPLTGVISNLGVVVWAATVAILGFSAALLARASEERRASRFLGMGAALTAILLADDLFLFHEYMFEGQIGLPEMVVFVAYAASTLGLVYAFSSEVRASEFPLLAVAIACFGVSVVADVLLDQNNDLTFLIEDGFKFIGITCWFAYFASTSFAAVSRHFRQE